MKIHLAALALVILGTACDPEVAPAPSEASFRDGEVIVPPTHPTGGSFTIKGGHDNPFEIMAQPYDKAPVEYQLAFEAEIQKQAVAVIEAEFLADEHNLEECPWSCEALGMTWNEGVYITELRVEHGAVRTESDPEVKGLYWTTEASASAEVGCGCI
jgi:hypothetical protein